MLSSKQRRFTEEYVISLNATDAALKAGYSAKSARSIGSENLRKPEVIQEIQRLENASKKAQQQEKKDAKENAAQARAELMETFLTLLDADMANIMGHDGNYLPLNEWPPENAFWVKSFKQIERVRIDPKGNGHITYKATKLEFHDRKPLVVQLGKMLDLWNRRPTAAEVRDAKRRREEKLRTGVTSRIWHEIAANLEVERRAKKKEDKSSAAPDNGTEPVKESAPQNPEPVKPPKREKPWKRSKISRR